MRLNNVLAFSYGKYKNTKGWPPERRLKQSARMRARKIWRRSTGPRTLSGKAISSYNAMKYGSSSAGWRELRRALGVYRRFLKHADFVMRSWFPENGKDAERNKAWNRVPLQSYVVEV